MRVNLLCVAGVCGLAASAMGQTVVNGDFETGDLTGWTVVNVGTGGANGAGAPGTVTLIDIDGPGPAGPSQAATFNVGMASYVAGGTGGIEMTQPLALQGGVAYTFEFDWLAQRQSTTNNAEGGVFSLIVDGVEIATQAAGSTTGMTPVPGHLSGNFTPPTSGNYNVGVRIMRPYSVAGLLYQYVDNFRGAGGTAPCYANCDQSTVTPVLNVQDFTCFLQRYAAGESYANCDESTIAPVLNVQDFTCFLQRYAAGCP